MNDINQNPEGKPLVSIIVPIYNTERYLAQCVESLLRQTLKNIEIILVDDGSPDNCPAMCDTYAAEDKRVKVIHQPNGGYGKACNAGFNIASGEYLGIVEPDDYAELDMFETLYSTSRDTHSPIIKGSFFHEYQNGTYDISSLRRVTKNRPKYTLQAKNSLYLMIYESSIWSAIYRRDFIKSNNIQMFETKGASYQDVIWKFETYAMAESITLIDKPVYHYRVMAQGSSSRSSKKYDAQFINYAEIKQFLVKNNRFEDYKKSYYLHQFFDTAFHLGRLDSQGRKQYCKKMKDVILTAKQEGITIDSFGDYDIPPDIRKNYHAIASGKVPRTKFLTQKIKQICLALYRSKIGKFLWYRLKKNANSRYIKKILFKLLDIDSRFTTLENSVILDKISFPSGKKNALVVVPFWSRSAACVFIENICNQFGRLGYSMHLLVYGTLATSPSDSVWEYIYTLVPISQDYGRPYPAGRDRTKFDTNLIDDWAGDDLMSFVSILDKNCNFDLCFCNYVFLSKVLTCFTEKTKKILCTHDVFSGRNEHLYKTGITDFYFGTVAEEEKKGLDRADCVMAIQNKESSFFKTLTDKPVITLPYVTSRKYQSHSFSGLPLKVGYIGGEHAPNIMAINEYIKRLAGQKNIAIYIAGSISSAIRNIPSNVYILGIIDGLDEFYTRYDLYINPDIFESGLKIKTVEAFSYGRPIICTRETSVGIDVKAPYHQLGSIKEAAEMTIKCVNNPLLLKEMAEESKRVFDLFFASYSMEKIISQVIGND